tara:strand:+ start:542 stop:763 length:222 start_codon:yes stop_codon:yes gene_type:complete
MSPDWPDRHANGGCTSADADTRSQPAKADRADSESVFSDCWEQGDRSAEEYGEQVEAHSPKDHRSPADEPQTF